MTKTISEPGADDPAPDISTEKVSFIIQLAREYEAPDDADPDASNATDDGFQVALTTAETGPARRDLASAIAALDEDEQIDLVALAWTGRGDFDASTWPDAVKTARERRQGSTARYLTNMELLAENLENGLGEFGLSFEEPE